MARPRLQRPAGQRLAHSQLPVSMQASDNHRTVWAGWSPYRSSSPIPLVTDRDIFSLGQVAQSPIQSDLHPQRRITTLRELNPTWLPPLPPEGFSAQTRDTGTPGQSSDPTSLKLLAAVLMMSL